jgi:PKD repeat protein
MVVQRQKDGGAWGIWGFVDTTQATVRDNQLTAGSTYNYKLAARNAAGMSAFVDPGGGGPPVANFSGNPTSGTAPLTVYFTDSSTNTPTSWSWTFGDGGTSTAQNPSHQYTSVAQYTVSLTATNSYGSDGETKTNYITVQAPAIPTFVAAGTVAYGTGAITPALPSGIATNDILLLFLETANQLISITNQNGGTWTAVANSPQGYGTAAAADATRLTVFWSRYNGTQGAPTTSDSGNHQIGRIIAVRGVTTSGDPWNVTAGGTESTVDTSGAIPGATTTVGNCLVVAAIATSLPDANGTANFSAWANANLTSVTERTDNTRSAGNGGGLGTATGGKATAGAYGNTTVTVATASTKAMMSIALKCQ